MLLCCQEREIISSFVEDGIPKSIVTLYQVGTDFKQYSSLRTHFHYVDHLCSVFKGTSFQGAYNEFALNTNKMIRKTQLQVLVSAASDLQEKEL